MLGTVVNHAGNDAVVAPIGSGASGLMVPNGNGTATVFVPGGVPTVVAQPRCLNLARASGYDGHVTRQHGKPE